MSCRLDFVTYPSNAFALSYYYRISFTAHLKLSQVPGVFSFKSSTLCSSLLIANDQPEIADRNDLLG